MKTLTPVPTDEQEIIVYEQTDPFGAHVFEVPLQALLNRIAALEARVTVLEEEPPPEI